MIQEDKEILLIDLSARLPYGTKVRAFIGEKGENDEILGCIHIFNIYAHNCKPYLRPMSSMTEEECIELGNIKATIENISEVIPNVPYYIEVAYSNQIDWLNAHHFDYRGLIEKGLALEAPEGMYNV